jgi:protein TonB
MVPTGGHKQVIAGEHLVTASFTQWVKPVYPKEARRKNIEGVVRLRALITKSGEVTGIAVLSGPPLLVASALAAVRQWRYVPFLLNGDPVELKMVIAVPFILSQ